MCFSKQNNSLRVSTWIQRLQFLAKVMSKIREIMMTFASCIYAVMMRCQNWDWDMSSNPQSRSSWSLSKLSSLCLCSCLLQAPIHVQIALWYCCTNVSFSATGLSGLFSLAGLVLLQVQKLICINSLCQNNCNSSIRRHIMVCMLM